MVYRILHFLAFLLEASVIQTKAERLPREYLKYFSTQGSPKGVLGDPWCLYTFVLQSNGAENLKIWKGCRGRTWEAQLSSLPATLTWNSSRCSLHSLPRLSPWSHTGIPMPCWRTDWPEELPQAKRTITIIRQDL